MTIQTMGSAVAVDTIGTQTMDVEVIRDHECCPDR